ncbi:MULTISPECIES: LysR family transcriptional regulator [unclassified Massilia]|uniref:LysR family transcriptional regulator n=1 Tax=unclassified Massilia TaxID=2609279 RepID=UPI001B8189B3|nr:MULTISPECIES: LysR family transcriptional regulator [unclassified Massilia]MBQ5941407.1 LysR family transcriptional regulator [Massilia sp. AB1]MBQ5962629.1 LysR family transcriptional regulator [Massilia sp. ZL223]
MDRLDELQVFLAILDTGSMAAAAHKLRRSPSAVTRMLATLEQRIGTRLFERSTRRLSATGEGQRLATHARRLLAEYESAMCEYQAGPPQGLLRITAPMVFGRRYMTSLATRFLMRHPDIQVDLVLADRNMHLIDNGVDIALRIGALENSGLVARELGAVKRITVASPDYLGRRGEPATPEELAQHELILGTAVRGLPEWRFGAAGSEQVVRFAPRLQVNDVEGVLNAAREGFGIARVLSYQAVPDLQAGALSRLLTDYEPAPLPVHLVFPSARHMAPRARAFVDFAIEEFTQLQAIH